MIDRQAAIDAVEHITSSMSVCVNSDECHGMKRMQRQAVIELANLPSAQSEVLACGEGELSAQPEIIRCKDCKWSDWYTCEDGMKRCYCMEHGSSGHGDDDYCSYAEREEYETN